MKKTAIISFFTALAAPIVSLAQWGAQPTSAGAPNVGYVENWITTLSEWLSRAITIIMVLMTLWFLIGVFQYIAEKDASKLPERRKKMFNGLIGLFVAVSVWGIIAIAQNVFGTKNANAPALTCPPGMVDRGYGLGCGVI